MYNETKNLTAACGDASHGANILHRADWLVGSHLTALKTQIRSYIAFMIWFKLRLKQNWKHI